MMQYIVKRGDTLSKISSEAYGSTGRSGDIAKFNELKNPNLIFEGQTLLLPEKEPSEQEEDLKDNLYRVRYGDTLSSISLRYLGKADKWKEIAQLNGITKPDCILVGQPLKLPSNAKPISTPAPTAQVRERLPAKFIPVRSFFFVIADEFLPSGRAVRKIIFPHHIQDNPELVKQIINPEKYGIHPKAPNSPVSPGRHVLGRTDSKYISVSSGRTGSPRFEGEPFWINMDKVKESGATIHDAEAIAQDLERIAKKSKDPQFLEYIEDISHKSRNIDKEILIEGSIPANAVKGRLSRGLNHSVRFVTAVGIGLSVYDLSKAANRSWERGLVTPLAAESVRQVGGWGSGVVGAKIGFAAGALFGIETGPGAFLTGTVGGFVFGIAGYMGADWIASWVESG